MKQAELQRLGKELFKTLQKEKLNFSDIQERYNLSKNQTKQVARELKHTYHIRTDGSGKYYVNTYPKPVYEQMHRVQIDGDEPIGFVGDTHLGSKYFNQNALEEFYDLMQSRGVKKAFHVGDLTDGHMVYKGQIEDLAVWGFEGQKNYTVEHYPKRRGIHTYIITGNHDDHSMRQGGANIVEEIIKLRKDMTYTGMRYARYNLENDERNIDLVTAHPTLKRAYAVSYASQIWLRDMPTHLRPDVAVNGHRHVVGYFKEGDSHLYEAGCFKELSPYDMDRGIKAQIASWILTPQLSNGALKGILSELYQAH